MKWHPVHITLLARHINVAPSHLRAIHKHRNAVVIAVAVTVITIFVCIWIVCTIVHASDVNRGDRFGFVLLHCRRRLGRRCVGSLVCLPASSSSSSSDDDNDRQCLDVSQYSVRYEYLLWARPAKARR